jgi:hypothetical protein
MGVGGQHHAPAVLPPEMTRYPLYRRLVGPQVRSRWLLKISPPIGIRFPDRPVRSELLYRLSYPGPRIAYYTDRKLMEQLPNIIDIFISRENVQNQNSLSLLKTSHSKSVFLCVLSSLVRPTTALLV